MARIHFDDMCRDVFQCENYIEWDEELEMNDHNIRHTSTIECVSCTKVGQSYNIEEYPEDCPHKMALDLFIIEKEKAIAQYEKEYEQDKIWKSLKEGIPVWKKATMF